MIMIKGYRYIQNNNYNIFLMLYRNIDFYRQLNIVMILNFEFPYFIKEIYEIFQ